MWDTSTILIDPPVFLLVALLGSIWARPERPWWIVAGLGYIMLDGMVTIAMPNPWHWHWNWLGKLASIAMALLIARLSGLTRNEVGLIASRVGSARAALLVGLAGVVASVIVNYLTRDHHGPGLETLAYEATMPGLSEELAFRGVLIGLFMRAYGSNRAAGFALAGIASTLVFGLGHGLTFDGSLHLAWLPTLFSGVLGGLFVWMRQLTGSILPSVLAHNATNVAGDFANGAR